MDDFKWDTTSILTFFLIYISFFLGYFVLIKTFHYGFREFSIFAFQFGIMTTWLFYHHFLFHKICKKVASFSKKHYRIIVYCQIAPALALYSTFHLMPIIRNFIGTGILQINTDYIVLFIGLTILNVGIFIFFICFKTLGINNVVFGNDYSCQKNKLIISSIYKYIRHPLVLGSYVISFALILIFSFNKTSFEIYFFNLLFLYFYMKTEDDRMIKIFGYEYREYIKKTGAFLPKFKDRYESDNI